MTDKIKVCTMLEAEELPTGSTDLHTSLTNVDCDDFSHTFLTLIIIS